jgi:hypothetical protein
VGHPLTDLFLIDYQVVDVSRPFAEDSYLEIEWALAQGRANTTCGGRWLTSDAFDSLYTPLVTAPARPARQRRCRPAGSAVVAQLPLPAAVPRGPERRDAA